MLKLTPPQKDKTYVFALKEFRNDCPIENFERESKVLQKLLDVPHKHITPHYASWSQAEHFFMLSPLASCNLKEYWRDNRPRPTDAEFVLWILRQLRGLADGLRHLYNLGARHGDLKGENILMFKEGDCGGPTLKIADFGSAKIHAQRSGPRDESNPTKSYDQGTSAYEAPDWLIRAETSRPYDVWTLGCIFLEMLIWTFGELPSDLDTFSIDRKTRGGKVGSDTMFWYVLYDGMYYTIHWKPAVIDRLQTLENQCNSDKGRAVFKELVSTTSKMLRMHPRARPKPCEIYNDMDRMKIWAELSAKKKGWNTLNIPIESTPSSAQSETPGRSNGDGVPVRAPHGHLMGDNVLRIFRKPKHDDTTLSFMGPSHNLDFKGNGSDLKVVIDGVDNISDGITSTLGSRDEPPLYGSHLLPSDSDPFAEAQTIVPSATTSELQLSSPSQLSSPLKRNASYALEDVRSVKRQWTPS